MDGRAGGGDGDDAAKAATAGAYGRVQVQHMEGGTQVALHTSMGAWKDVREGHASNP